MTGHWIVQIDLDSFCLILLKPSQMEGTMAATYVLTLLIDKFLSFGEMLNSSCVSADARPQVRLQTAAADLLMKIKHSCRTSQKAVDCLVDGVNGVLKIYLEVLKVTIEHKSFLKPLSA